MEWLISKQYFLYFSDIGRFKHRPNFEQVCKENYPIWCASPLAIGRFASVERPSGTYDLPILFSFSMLIVNGTGILPAEKGKPIACISVGRLFDNHQSKTFALFRIKR